MIEKDYDRVVDNGSRCYPAMMARIGYGILSLVSGIVAGYLGYAAMVAAKIINWRLDL